MSRGSAPHLPPHPAGSSVGPGTGRPSRCAAVRSTEPTGALCRGRNMTGTMRRSFALSRPRRRSVTLTKYRVEAHSPLPRPSSDDSTNEGGRLYFLLAPCALTRVIWAGNLSWKGKVNSPCSLDGSDEVLARGGPLLSDHRSTASSQKMTSSATGCRPDAILSTSVRTSPLSRIRRCVTGSGEARRSLSSAIRQIPSDQHRFSYRRAGSPLRPPATSR